MVRRAVLRAEVHEDGEDARWSSWLLNARRRRFCWDERKRSPRGTRTAFHLQRREAEPRAPGRERPEVGKPLDEHRTGGQPGDVDGDTIVVRPYRRRVRAHTADATLEQRSEER